MDPRRILLILLCSILLGFCSSLAMHAISRHNRLMEAQTAALEAMAKECPCAKKGTSRRVY